MSLGNSRGDTAYIYDECLKSERLLMGFGGKLNFGKCQSVKDIRALLESEEYIVQGDNSYAVTALSSFVLDMKKGDLVVVTEGLTKFRAIAEITGDYEPIDRSNEDDTYGQGRKVRWLRQFAPSLDADKLLGRRFSQMTLYRLHLSDVEKENLRNLLAPQRPQRVEQPYVCIIDEINRGNIAAIFGELITLIEESKRTGRNDALQVQLPYSRENFAVPHNLYIIGTMNSADRSLTGLDLALRRRFSFVEMLPNPSLLDDRILSGTNISVGSVLRAMNERIEVLLDKDHCIGHAPFIPLEQTVTVDALKYIFLSNILPLLQEYFFEDWDKIRRVLNDHQKNADSCFVQEKTVPVTLLDEGNPQKLWKICHEALNKMTSYAGIVDASVKVEKTPAPQLSTFVQDIHPESIIRQYQWEGYTLIQYKDKNNQKAIYVDDNGKLVHRDSSESNENIKIVLRKINIALNLGITEDKKYTTRQFADVLLDRLGITVQS